MTLIAELRRRNVLRVGAAYLVVAWLVIQVVETILPAFGFGDAAVRNTTIVFGIGFVPALILAWVFELTPEGLRRESELDRSRPAAPQTGKRLDRAIMVVLALGLALFAFDKFVLSPQRQAASEQQKLAEVERARHQGRAEALIESYGDNSIAVLPFVNMSDDAGNEYFSDGISEELLNLLAKIPELRVISRTSSFSYKGRSIKLAQVAEELNVAHVLEGSVRKAGERVRVTAQLIDARSDTHLWSETFDRTLDDIFAIQGEIAATVVDQLRVTLLGTVPQARETDPMAYALYLEARHVTRHGTVESLQRAMALLDGALALDPEYADALVLMAGVYMNQAGAGMRPAGEAYALAREAVERALALDPDNAQAHARLGWIAMSQDDDLAPAAGHFERALALDPANHLVISSAVWLLVSLGRIDEAVVLDEYLVSRDPVSPQGHFNLGDSLLRAGRWDDAIAAYQAALRLNPGLLFAHFRIGAALLMKGEAEAALQAFEQETDEDSRVQGMAMALHALGRPPEDEPRLLEAIERVGSEWPSVVAVFYAWTGATDEAFRRLEQAVEFKQPGLSGIGSWPLLARLHDDPRWPPFLESIGQSPERLGNIAFQVTLPVQ